MMGSPPLVRRTRTHSPLVTTLSEGFSHFVASMSAPVASDRCGRWRDLHPLEWQLASLHQNRTCGFPAFSHLG
jgi:hypothetical protein